MATSHETVCRVKTGVGTISLASLTGNVAPSCIYIVAIINATGGGTVTIDSTDDIVLAVGQAISFPSPIACTSFTNVADTSVVYYYS